MEKINMVHQIPDTIISPVYYLPYPEDATLRLAGKSPKFVFKHILFEFLNDTFN